MDNLGSKNGLMRIDEELEEEDRMVGRDASLRKLMLSKVLGGGKKPDLAGFKQEKVS